MRKFNVVAYVALVVLVTPVMFVLSVGQIGLGLMKLILEILKGLINAFLFWLMPDEIKAKAQVEALAAQARATEKHDI